MTARVYAALLHGNKTIAEIDAWGRFDGPTERFRQQMIGGLLYRLKQYGFVELAGYRRPSPESGLPNNVYRATGRKRR